MQVKIAADSGRLSTKDDD